MGFGDDRAPNPAPPCGQCADPQTKGIHSGGCPRRVQFHASGKNPRYTLEVLQRILLHSIALANSIVGPEHQVPGYREAVLALPNRRLLRGLPMEVRSFIEREIDALEPGCECHQEFGDSPCPKHGMEGA